MGSAISGDYAEDFAPPLPSRASLFVVRNGRYEPENLMPTMPRSGFLDFQGQYLRRGARGGPCVPPPELRQGSLVKNPASIRRDSARLVNLNVDGSALEHSALSLVFDAQSSGTLSVRILMHERPAGSAVDGAPTPPLSIGLVSQVEADLEGNHSSAASSIEEDPFLVAALDPAPTELDEYSFGPGLGQRYQSPPIDFSRWPSHALAYNARRPRNVPIAVTLKADTAEGEETSVHYTYISLTENQSTPSGSGGSQRSVQIYAQKLQYGGQCFVLHEVFGVSSKCAAPDETDMELEGGNSECVICLSEPRDTAVLPCRHMCFCSYCAGIVRLQCEKCPVCRQKVVSLLQFKRGADPLEAALGVPAAEAALPPRPAATGLGQMQMQMPACVAASASQDS